MGVRTLRWRRLETHDLRNVGDHVDEGTAGQAWVDGHEVSNPIVIVISWSAERIGPRIIAAPQRGHVHVAAVAVSVVGGVAAADGHAIDEAASTVRARVTRAVRQAFARNPD